MIALCVCVCFFLFSLEEAKKKIYAICTTSYQGFQASMSIAEVEKFRGNDLEKHLIR